MEFNLSEDHQMIQEMVRRFAREELAPMAAKIDSSCEFPWENIRKMAALNLLGVTVPEEYGGAAMDAMSYVVVIEEIARACAATAVIVAVQNSLAEYPIYTFGSPEQKTKYLPVLASGEKIGAYALTEPNAGSDAGAIETVAVKKDGRYYLSGTKTFITNSVAAEIFIVYATVDRASGSRGISAFLVEKGFPGFTVGRHEEMMGVRASGTCQLIFDNCEVPAENLLGKEGDGFKIALSTLDIGRMGIAAQAVGIAQAAFDLALGYSKERKQFGQSISNFQMIQAMLVEMATDLDASRLLLYRSACLRDEKKPFTKEVSMAKLFASEAAVRAANCAVQILGGYGYSKEYAAERYYRDAKITTIYEGTSEVQRIVIARNLLKG